MKTARRLFKSLFVHHRNLTAVVTLAVVALVLGMASGFWLMYRLFYVLIGLVTLSYLWGKANLRGLEVWADRRTDRVQEGQRAEERIHVRNRGVLGKLWLEVDDPSDLPGHQAQAVVTLGGRTARSWRIFTYCGRRGIYSVGPAQVTTGDPFGLFRFSQPFGPAQHILVYPSPVDLPHFWVPPAHLPGEGRLRRRTHYVTPNASDVREWQSGDSFNRIHWPSTAHTGQLMVKTFELDPASEIWIVLDLEATVQVGAGDESTEEYGVKIAASVARHYLMAHRPVGLLSYGRTLDVVEPDRGDHQMTRILESLAMARAIGDVPLSNLLDNESRRFGRHTSLVLITPSPDESWVISLHSLLQRGVKAAAVLLEPESFGSQQSSLSVYSALMASDVVTYLVHQGEDLSAALAPTGGVSTAAR